MDQKDNICQLHPAAEPTERPVAEVLEEAVGIAADLSQVLVLGLGSEGEVISLSSHVDPALVVLMCERAKAQILRDLG